MGQLIKFEYGLSLHTSIVTMLNVLNLIIYDYVKEYSSVTHIEVFKDKGAWCIQPT